MSSIKPHWNHAYFLKGRELLIRIIVWDGCRILIAYIFTFRLMEPQPNSYAYTKSLTEDLVSQYVGKFPIVIARPSIGKSPQDNNNN